MSHSPSELKYASSHEWARLDDDGLVTVGITDHAQEALGDVVFVELPELGALFAAGQEAGVVESVKAASDVYAPVSGEVVEVNGAIVDSPELINQDPYAAWIIEIKPSDPAEFGQLHTAAAYLEMLRG